MSLKRIFFTVGVTKLEKMHSYTFIEETKTKICSSSKTSVHVFCVCLGLFIILVQYQTQQSTVHTAQQLNTDSLVKRKYRLETQKTHSAGLEEKALQDGEGDSDRLWDLSMQDFKPIWKNSLKSKDFLET